MFPYTFKTLVSFTIQMRNFTHLYILKSHLRQLYKPLISEFLKNATTYIHIVFFTNLSSNETKQKRKKRKNETNNCHMLIQRTHAKHNFIKLHFNKALESHQKYFGILFFIIILHLHAKRNFFVCISFLR